MTATLRYRIFLPSHFAAVSQDPKDDGPARTRAEKLGLEWDSDKECYRTSKESAADVMEKLGCNVFDNLLPGYERAIWQATKCEEDDACVIEELMRVQRGTLDSLDLRTFNKEARTAAQTLVILREEDPEVATWYEESARQYRGRY